MEMIDPDTEVQCRVFFPDQWHINICLKWLGLRGLEIPLGHTEANVYGFDSIFAVCPDATHGYWYGTVPLRYCFKKLLSPRNSR